MFKREISLTILSFLILSTLCALSTSAETETVLTEDEKRICLNNEECNENITYCPVEGCCAFKECSPEGNCIRTLSQCFKQRYEDLNDGDCFWETNCYRSITSCSNGCCGFKECNKGNCSVNFPLCINLSPLGIPDQDLDTPSREDLDTSEPLKTPKKGKKRICTKRYRVYKKYVK